MSNENYQLVDTPAKLENLHNTLKELPDNHVVGYDHETTGFYWMTDVVVGTSFSWAEGEASYLPYWHIDRDNYGFGREEIRAVIQELKRFRVIAHKVVFDTSFTFMTFGINIPIWDDTFLLAKLLEKPLKLSDIVLQEFGVQRSDFEQEMAKIFGKNWKSQGYTCADADAEQFSYYACADADDCRRVYFKYKPLLAERGLTSLHKVEVNILPMVRRMNIKGVPVDAKTASLISSLLTVQNDKIEKDIYELAGHEFKINSPKELPAVLFGELGLPVIKRSPKTGAPSTDKDCMDALQDAHPIVPPIRQWREDTRLNKAYMGKIPRMVREGRVHTEFNSFGAVSGRFTSSGNENSQHELMGFNLQNIAKKGIDLVVEQTWILPEGRAVTDLPVVRELEGGEPVYSASTLMEQECTPILGLSADDNTRRFITHWDMSAREMFVAPEGWTWVKADQSQIEYRLLANLSGEDYLISRFKRGIDFHSVTAAIFLDILDSEVTPEQRKTGKTVNFTMAYGGGHHKVAKSLKISEHEAERGFERYWERLPKVAALAEFCRERAKVEGITKTYFGLVRTLNLHNVPHKVMQSELRKALNTMIQGSASEFLKLGMLRVEDALRSFKKNVEMVLQVHDELDFLVRTDILFEVLPVIKKAMEVPCPPHWCELKVDIGYGPNWAEKCHTTYEAPEDYKQEEFTGWKNVIPESFSAHADV